LLFALVAVLALPCFAQEAGSYLVTDFSNNPATGSSSVDQQIRLINFGATGAPALFSPDTGDSCANIYVFDAGQELEACCACRITPNGLLSISVANQLTNNTLTGGASGIRPTDGVIKVIFTKVGTPTPSQTTCDARQAFNGVLTAGIGYHLFNSNTSAGRVVSETRITAPPLSTTEASFLPMACMYAVYFGSGHGVCTCPPAP
jgi:hypothetical protein